MTEPHQIAANLAAFAMDAQGSINRAHRKGGGMDRIRIVGGSKLNGTIAISGAKNEIGRASCRERVCNGV